VWGEPKDAVPLLRFLAEIFTSGKLDEVQIAGFRKTYERALGDVVQTDANPFGTGTPLLISRAGVLSVLANSAVLEITPETIYVKDGPVGLADYLLESLGASVVSAPDGTADRVVSLIKRGFGERVRSASEVQVGVLVDSVPFTPTAAVPLLSDEWPWLESFVALSMEFRSSRFDHRTEAVQRRILDRLARVRLKRALHVGISIDGKETELPPFMKNAVPVRDDVLPTIVLSGDGPLTWSDLIALAPALAEVLHQPSLENGFTVCLLELERLLGSPVRMPTEEEYAEVFRTRPEEVRRLLALTKGLVHTILDRLYPVVAHKLGVDAAERLNPNGGGADLGTPEAIRAALVELGARPRINTSGSARYGL